MSISISGNNSGGGTNNVPYIESTIWGDFTSNAVKISPVADHEAILLQSDEQALLRYHVRDSAWQNNVVVTGVQSYSIDGSDFWITYTVTPEERALPTGLHYFVSNFGPWGGYVQITASTLNTLTIWYPSASFTEADVQDLQALPTEAFSGCYINLPSIYSQFRVTANGSFIQNANWTETPTYYQYWHFDNAGNLTLPYGNVAISAPTGDLNLVSNNANIIFSPDGDIYKGSATANNRIATIGDLIPAKSYLFASSQNEATTATSAALDTYAELNDTLTANNEYANLQLQNGQNITNTGSSTMVVKFTGTITMRAKQSYNVISVAFFKNDAAAISEMDGLTGQAMEDPGVSANEWLNLAWQTVVSLAPGDYVSVHVKDTSSDVDIVSRHVSVIATEL